MIFKQKKRRATISLGLNFCFIGSSQPPSRDSVLLTKGNYYRHEGLPMAILDGHPKNLNLCVISRVMDPDLDPDWIQIQRLCRSGSGTKKLRNFSGKNALFSYLKKNFTTEKL
jgi:hypothetical protein